MIKREHEYRYEQGCEWCHRRTLVFTLPDTASSSITNVISCSCFYIVGGTVYWIVRHVPLLIVWRENRNAKEVSADFWPMKLGRRWNKCVKLHKKNQNQSDTQHRLRKTETICLLVEKVPVRKRCQAALRPTSALCENRITTRYHKQGADQSNMYSICKRTFLADD